LYDLRLPQDDELSYRHSKQEECVVLEHFGPPPKIWLYGDCPKLVEVGMFELDMEF